MLLLLQPFLCALLLSLYLISLWVVSKSFETLPPKYPLFSKTSVSRSFFKALPTSLRVPAPCDYLHRKTNHARRTLRPLDLNTNPDTSLSIVPNCQITDLVLAFNYKAADLLSDKSIPFQKKGWRNFHSKMRAKLISPP